MSKFKKGDVVICEQLQIYTEGGNDRAQVEVGYVGVVTDVTLGGSISVDNKLGICGPCFSPYAFELHTRFNMHKSKWFIRFSNEAEFYLVRDFVKARGIEFKYGEEFDRDHRYVAVAMDHYGSGEVVRMQEEDLLTDDFKEIKLNFKVEIDSIEWPGVKSQPETVELNGKKYNKEELEKALSFLKPIED